MESAAVRMKMREAPEASAGDRKDPCGRHARRRALAATPRFGHARGPNSRGCGKYVMSRPPTHADKGAERRGLQAMPRLLKRGHAAERGGIQPRNNATRVFLGANRSSPCGLCKTGRLACEDRGIRFRSDCVAPVTPECTMIHMFSGHRLAAPCPILARIGCVRWHTYLGLDDVERGGGSGYDQFRSVLGVTAPLTRLSRTKPRFSPARLSARPQAIAPTTRPSTKLAKHTSSTKTPMRFKVVATSGEAGRT